MPFGEWRKMRLVLVACTTWLYYFSNSAHPLSLPCIDGSACVGCWTVVSKAVMEKCTAMSIQLRCVFCSCAVRWYAFDLHGWCEAAELVPYAVIINA